MGEIKSTLDLVLEKTKHLSQSSEEKQAQAQRDTQRRLKGILQKYQDGLISLVRLQREYEGLQTEFKLADNSALAGQVIDRLDPNGDNRALFEVLDQCCHLDSSGLADLIHQYQAGYQKAAQSRREGLKASLAQNHNISGSAVVPNLETDEKWRREAQVMISTVKDKLNQERVKLVSN